MVIDNSYPIYNRYPHRRQAAEKCQRGARTVHLDMMTVSVLGDLAVLEEIRRQAGARWNEHGSCCPGPDGTWCNPPAVMLAIIRAVKGLAYRGSGSMTSGHTHRTPQRCSSSLVFRGTNDQQQPDEKADDVATVKPEQPADETLEDEV